MTMTDPYDGKSVGALKLAIFTSSQEPQTDQTHLAEWEMIVAQFWTANLDFGPELIIIILQMMRNIITSTIKHLYTTT